MRLDIVVPAHNEQDRIDRMLTAYRSRIASPTTRFIVALDRCTDGTHEVVARHARVDGRIEVMPYPKLGKGGVIMETLRRCDADALAFVDADCATPPVELLTLVDALEHADIAIASRWHPAAVVPARRSFGRRLTSAGFAWGIRRLFGLPYRDTQCGAKAIRRQAAEEVLPLLSSRDFLFDVDLLLTARSLGLRIVEVPTVWVDQAGSRLNAARDARRMALSALRLWIHNRVLPVAGGAGTSPEHAGTSPEHAGTSRGHAGTNPEPTGDHRRRQAPPAPWREPQPRIDLRDRVVAAEGGTHRHDQEPGDQRTGDQRTGDRGAMLRQATPADAPPRPHVRRARKAAPMPDVTLIAPYPNRKGEAGSGVGWYTQQLARAMTDQGAAVTVVAPRLGDDALVDRDGPVQVRRFRRGPDGLLRAAARAVGTGSPIVHLQHEVFLYGGPSTIPAALPALAALRAAGRGPVLTMHQVVDPEEIDGGFTDLHRVRIPAGVARLGLGTLQSSLSSLARTTVVHEPAFLDLVGDARVLPIGADRPAQPGDGAAMRANWSIAPEEFVVLCFGFVAPYKGLEVVLEAAELAGTPVRVVVAGGEHPRLVGQGYVESLISRYAPGAIFTGYVDDADVSAWFAAADLAAIAYPRVFSSSGVLSIALAHGTPLLLSPSVARVHGAPEELAADLQPNALADHLRGLAGSPGRLEQAAIATQSLSAGNRSWADLARRHLDLYEEVTDAQRRLGRRYRHRPDRGASPGGRLLDLSSGVRRGAGAGAVGQASGGVP